MPLRDVGARADEAPATVPERVPAEGGDVIRLRVCHCTQVHLFGIANVIYGLAQLQQREHAALCVLWAEP